MLQFVHAVAAGLIAADGSGARLAPWLGLLLLAAVVGLVVGAVRLRALTQELARRQEATQQLTLMRQEVQQREARLTRDLEARRDELRQLKQEVAIQRKKNHAGQQEVRELREALREQQRLRLEAQNTRPAFSEAAAPPAPTPAPVKVVSLDKPRAAPPAAEPPSPDSALVKRIASLEAAAREDRARLETERQAAALVLGELRKLRKRSEDLRRIDIITKSKMEVLEDKWRTLGRQYYEAVSELAVLKGEVAPPRPRDVPRAVDALRASEREDENGDVPEHDANSAELPHALAMADNEPDAAALADEEPDAGEEPDTVAASGEGRGASDANETRSEPEERVIAHAAAGLDGREGPVDV